jgi:hypothetical protein
MILEAKFNEVNHTMNAELGEVNVLGGYDAGYNKGHHDGYEHGEADGINQGIEIGKQTEYDRFWDDFQQNGQRGGYGYAFGGPGWTDETLKPKYLPLGDHVGWSCNMNYSFYYAARITKTPPVGCYTYTGWTRAFYECTNLEEIGEIFYHNGVGANATKTCIGRDFDCPHSPKLKPESMIMVINKLEDYSGTADASKYKITFHATAWANLEAHSTAPNGGTWKDYVTSKGWLYG